MRHDNQSKGGGKISNWFRMLEFQHLHGKHCRSHEPNHKDTACIAHNCPNTTRQRFLKNDWRHKRLWKPCHPPKCIELVCLAAPWLICQACRKSLYRLCVSDIAVGSNRSLSERVSVFRHTFSSHFPRSRSRIGPRRTHLRMHPIQQSSRSMTRTQRPAPFTSRAWSRIYCGTLLQAFLEARRVAGCARTQAGARASNATGCVCRHAAHRQHGSKCGNKRLPLIPPREMLGQVSSRIDAVRAEAQVSSSALLVVALGGCITEQLQLPALETLFQDATLQQHNCFRGIRVHHRSLKGVGAVSLENLWCKIVWSRHTKLCL